MGAAFRVGRPSWMSVASTILVLIWISTTKARALRLVALTMVPFTRRLMTSASRRASTWMEGSMKWEVSSNMAVAPIF